MGPCVRRDDAALCEVATFFVLVVIPGRERSETNPESITPVFLFGTKRYHGAMDSGLALRASTRDCTASIHHDLDAVAHLDLGAGVEAVEDAEALDRMVDAGHAVR